MDNIIPKNMPDFGQDGLRMLLALARALGVPAHELFQCLIDYYARKLAEED